MALQGACREHPKLSLPYGLWAYSSHSDPPCGLVHAANAKESAHVPSACTSGLPFRSVIKLILTVLSKHPPVQRRSQGPRTAEDRACPAEDKAPERVHPQMPLKHASQQHLCQF